MRTSRRPPTPASAFGGHGAIERPWRRPRVRSWHLDERSERRPNKWRAWSSFKEQGYINQLDLPTFRKLAKDAGFDIVREELHSFGGSRIRQAIGRTLMAIPYLGEYFVSFVILELRRGEVQR